MSKIEWTEKTWNPIVGCSIVSPGCINCYAMKMADRLQAMSATQFPHYQGTTKRVNGNPVWTGKMALAPYATLTAPLRRKKPTLFFVNSMSDLFHESVPDAWIDRVFAVMALCPQHTFQVLTKRSARMRAYLTRDDVAQGWVETPEWRDADARCDADDDLNKPQSWHEQTARLEHVMSQMLGDESYWPLPNVWIGVSAEDQRRADERIPDLLATPAAVRFVSAEPLLGPVDFNRIDIPGYGYLNAFDDGYFVDGRAPRRRLDWIIVGGESGPNARPMHSDWARSIRDQCTAAGVAFFFKQWGEWMPVRADRHGADGFGKCYWPAESVDPTDAAQPIGRNVRTQWVERRPHSNSALVACVGKSRAGRLLDGRTWDEYPSTSTVTPPAAEEAAA